MFAKHVNHGQKSVRSGSTPFAGHVICLKKTPAKSKWTDPDESVSERNHEKVYQCLFTDEEAENKTENTTEISFKTGAQIQRSKFYKTFSSLTAIVFVYLLLRVRHFQPIQQHMNIWN